MYFVYGASRSSLLIESTDSMIAIAILILFSIVKITFNYDYSYSYVVQREYFEVLEQAMLTSIPILLKEASHTAIANAPPGKKQLGVRSNGYFYHAGLPKKESTIPSLSVTGHGMITDERENASALN